MSEYFYTVELSAEDGKRLETMAEESGWEDREAFAAMLIREGLALLEQRRAVPAQLPKPTYDLGDDIPF